MIIDSAKYSCAGGHEINEDSCLGLPERGIFIVADGLGGHTDGEKASIAAIDYFERSCRGNYTDEEITRLLEEANIEVLNKGDGGKTTVAAAFTENGKFIYANVGDSRVYYFRSGKIIAVTKDHSVCQASVDMGMMRPEDIRGSEDRSRLLKVLGAEKVLNIKKRYQPIEVQNGDAFLICSDGFWEYVYETEMEIDLHKSESAEQWLKYMLKRHILRAENKGDNYTAVCGIIRFEDGDNAPVPISDSASSGAEAAKNKNFPIFLIAAVAAVIAVIALCLVFLPRGNVPGVDNSKSEAFNSETHSAVDESDTTTSAENPSDTASGGEKPSDTVSSTEKPSDTTSSAEKPANTTSSAENPSDTGDTSANISDPGEAAQTA